MANSINEEKLNSLRELMGDMFDTLVDTFITDAISAISSMHNEFAAGNVTEVHRLAHSLKSSSANLGADMLSEAARQLEHEAKEGDLSQADTHINKLESLCKDAAETLKQLSA